MAKRRKQTDAQHDKLFTAKRYTRRTVYQDREYGIFWYAWLWHALRPVVIFVCSLLIVVGMAATAWDRVYGGYIAAPDASDTESLSFTISSGDTITTIGKKLVDQEYIRSTSLFKYYIQFYGLTNKIQSGVYNISKSMNLFQVVDVISSGNATNERTIRIIPGWTCEDIADYLVSVGAIANRESFLAECRRYDGYLGYSLALLNVSESDDLAARTYPLEGFLAPDTYRVYLSADSESIIRTLLKQTDVLYDSLLGADDPNKEYASGLSAGDIFTLASIIEKEARTPEDMKRVSAVFHNRLKQGWRLQSDPTATYLTDTTKLALTNADISVVTAYNTYLIYGLPVGPICNPSRNALIAALNPDERYMTEGYMYFCAAEPGTGKIAFAKTDAEHNANVAKYRPLWEEYDRKNE